MGGKGSGLRKSKTPPKFYRPGWLARADGRTRPVKQMRVRVLQIASDLGGLESTSAIERSILERFVHCEAFALQAEEKARAGEAIELAEYLGLVDRVARLGQVLGLSRRQREISFVAAAAEAVTRADRGEGES